MALLTVCVTQREGITKHQYARSDMVQEVKNMNIVHCHTLSHQSIWRDLKEAMYPSKLWLVCWINIYFNSANFKYGTNLHVDFPVTPFWNGGSEIKRTIQVSGA